MSEQQQPKEYIILNKGKDDTITLLSCDNRSEKCPENCIHKIPHLIRECNGLCPIDKKSQLCCPIPRPHPTPAPCKDCNYNHYSCAQGVGKYPDVCKDKEEWLQKHDAAIARKAREQVLDEMIKVSMMIETNETERWESVGRPKNDGYINGSHSGYGHALRDMRHWIDQIKKAESLRHSTQEPRR